MLKKLKSSFLTNLTKEQKEEWKIEKLYRGVYNALSVLDLLRLKQLNRKWNQMISDGKDLSKYIETFPGVPNL